MHTDNQYLLIVGSVKDSDPTAFRQTLGCAPQKIVFQFRSTWMFETEYLTALGIDAGHHMLDSPILSGRVHPLKNQQYRIAVGCVMKLLQCAQFPHLFSEEF